MTFHHILSDLVSDFGKGSKRVKIISGLIFLPGGSNWFCLNCIKKPEIWHFVDMLSFPPQTQKLSLGGP